MATNKNNKYDYVKVALYFDLSKPFQKEAYHFIKKAGHKKTTLIGILVHHFLQQFGQSELSSTDLKNYIQSYSTICKANIGIPYIQPISSQITMPPVLPNESTERNTLPSPIKNAKEDILSSSITCENVSSSKDTSVSEEEMDYINTMMSGFSIY